MNLELMLDSGAFTARRQRVTIHLKDYARFVLDNPGVFNVVANLDVIPISSNPKDIARAVDQGWDNWVELTRLLKPAGIKPLHTYHLGEPPWVLEKLKKTCEYFALGGFATKPLVDKMNWLKRIMPRLTDSQGNPTHKFHGFGATSIEIMDRFPFYSVDSKSWLDAGRNGAVLIPSGVLGPHHRRIVFSDDPRVMHSRTADHFRSLGDVERKPVLRYLESQGMTAQMLAEDYVQRDVMNARFFLEYERTRDAPLKIFLAGLKTEVVERAILQVGVTRRLHSFAKKEWIEKNYIPLYRQLRAPLAGSAA